MAKFLQGNLLNLEVQNIFKNATSEIILFSPFIKLHHRYVDQLKSKINDDKLSITIVFGKNEQDIAKSLALEDFEFFKEFPNIEIRYEKRLHAKFYANESSQIITSMNLYDFSQDENIEVGVKTDYHAIKDIATLILPTTFDTEAWDYFNELIEKSELLFKNTPTYDSGRLGWGKKYSGIQNKVDKLSEIYKKPSKPKEDKKYTKTESRLEMGYCIRTGEMIPFNPSKPLSEPAYWSWAQYENPNYKEKYCHKTGKPSNGRTSMANPIL